MKIREVNENKKQFISLLLLADEQESMVDRYLEKGIIFFIQSPFLRFCYSLRFYYKGSGGHRFCPS